MLAQKQWTDMLVAMDIERYNLVRVETMPHAVSMTICPAMLKDRLIAWKASVWHQV